MASSNTASLILALVALAIPPAAALSTSTGVTSPREHVPRFKTIPSSSYSQLWLSRQQPPRSFSLVSTVQPNSVDVDRKSIKDLQGNPKHEVACETALDAKDIEIDDKDVRELPQKILNAVVLAVSFGWAAYTILTIDAGMTRGWTQSEIAMRIPLDNWSSYESSLMSKPIFTKTLINLVIYLLGDWLSQTLFRKKNVLDFDVVRTLKNGFIGLCFGPLVHEYYAFSDNILPVEGGLMNRVEKIFMDQTIYLTIKCSIYIFAVGLLSGDSWDTCQKTVQEKIAGIVVTAWKFWPLVHCVTYGVVPARHRILWVNSVDLVWNAILATQAQKRYPDKCTSDDADTTKDVLSCSNAKVPILTATAPAKVASAKTEDNAMKGEEPQHSSIFKEVLVTGSAAELSHGEETLSESREQRTKAVDTAASKPDNKDAP